MLTMSLFILFCLWLCNWYVVTEVVVFVILGGREAEVELVNHTWAGQGCFCEMVYCLACPLLRCASRDWALYEA